MPRIHPDDNHVEIVERKGRGHPDSLADALAERLSVTYSTECLEKFGVILRHQFDKLTLMCGASEVWFGGGRVTSPIRVLINGRAAPGVGEQRIDIRELAIATVKEFFAERLPVFDVERDIRILFEMNQSTTGGIRFHDPNDDADPIHYWFRPRSPSDIPELEKVLANDTSLGYAFAPLSHLERVVKTAEETLNGAELRGAFPWVGSDIKVMAVRILRSVKMTVAVPQICTYVSDLSDYCSNLSYIHGVVRNICNLTYPSYDYEITINPGDDTQRRKLYMSLSGSSIEKGDEGQVGRGNRIGGVIAPMRFYTMEGICGKNPLYHVGKVYSAAAYKIAYRLYEEFDSPSDVFAISQMGRSLNDPLALILSLDPRFHDAPRAIDIADNVFANLNEVTDEILQGRYPFA